MSFTVEDVVQRHRELTAEVANISARHADELRPTIAKIDAIEAWLLAKMNADGCQNYKTAHGTAYQSRIKQVKLTEPTEFRNFILRPAAAHIIDMVRQMGGQVADPARDTEAILHLLGTLSLWDLADFKPGKKGIVAYMDEKQTQVPGVAVNEIINVNVRGS